MRKTTLAVAALCLASCVSTVDVSHSIQPSHSVATKSTERAAVICTDELLSRVERAAVFEVALGEPLCAALERSVQGVFRAAQRTSKPTYPGEYGRVIRFDLRDSSLTVEQKSNKVVRVSCALSVAVARFGRDNQRLGNDTAVTGQSFVERADAPETLVREAVEAALQQVSDNATTLLGDGIDGPRQTLSSQ